TNGAVGDLFSPHLDGNNDVLHDCGIDESCSNGKRERYVQKEHKDRPGHGTCANPGNCNRERYEKANSQFHEVYPDLLLRLNVDAAFLLAARPATRSRIVCVGWKAGAGFAPDALVNLVIERQQWNGMRPFVVPD